MEAPVCYLCVLHKYAMLSVSLSVFGLSQPPHTLCIEEVAGRWWGRKAGW